MGPGTSQFFLSFLVPLGNVQPSGLLFCVPLTPMCGLDLLDPFLHCISPMSPGAPLVRSWGRRRGSPKAGKGRESWFWLSLERASRCSKCWDVIPEPPLPPCCASCPPHLWSCTNLSLTQPSISVPAITMTRVIRDSYHSAQNRFEAEPLPCTPPPRSCWSSSRRCRGTQQQGLLESKDDSLGFRSLQRYVPPA